jgi:DNA-binding NarL/FixJ family response regulator
MLVDDHPLWLETLRQTLERAGVCRIVAEATNGSEALELAATAKPQVVIMDMELPVLDGVKATRRLLADLPETKVLVLSASCEEDLVVRAIRAGANGYLLKTAIADDVADAVTRVASGEMVLPAEVAPIVLAELRGTTKKRPLATVLFTDIVSSTERMAEIGDREWSDLLTQHNKIVSRAIAEFRGRHVDSAGDGVLATFDGPARAIRCACAIRDALRPSGSRCGQDCTPARSSLRERPFEG